MFNTTLGLTHTVTNFGMFLLVLGLCACVGLYVADMGAKSTYVFSLLKYPLGATVVGFVGTFSVETLKALFSK